MNTPSNRVYVATPNKVTGAAGSLPIMRIYTAIKSLRLSALLKPLMTMI